MAALEEPTSPLTHYVRALNPQQMIVKEMVDDSEGEKSRPALCIHPVVKACPQSRMDWRLFHLKYQLLLRACFSLRMEFVSH
ncbi:hypothetical protein ACO22_02860 [Paracoccidioides brasiliensis]|uniref:Uncharacterized protein n=1 Tax=Paracoccidioides brasiliensis TaxID=121759 RepID=A0A1D2JHM0_PARBR|nr:hypothetical protein ACO22_02860 [Paracoccidioides brasiliensis]